MAWTRYSCDHSVHFFLIISWGPFSIVLVGCCCIQIFYWYEPAQPSCPHNYQARMWWQERYKTSSYSSAERQSQTYLCYPSNEHWNASSAIAKWDLRGFCCLMFLNLNWKGNEGILWQSPDSTFPFSCFSFFAAGSFFSNLNIKCFSSLFLGEGQFQRGMEALNSSYQCFITNEMIANISSIHSSWNCNAFILCVQELYLICGYR